MIYLLIGIVALVLAIVGMRAFLTVNPAQLAQFLRVGFGYSALALAGILALTGRVVVAAPLAAAGLLLVRRSFGMGGFPGTGRPSPGMTSRVRTATLEMTLDHDTGIMDGDILAGPHAGARLSALSPDDLVALWRDCGTSDVKAMQLLEAYLDQAHQGWRERAGDSGNGGHDQQRQRAPEGGPMTREEACEILGVGLGSSKDDIRRAHRALMKKLHPDQGGSNYLASKVNEAKDILMRA